jgi:prophage regulatory protein
VGLLTRMRIIFMCSSQTRRILRISDVAEKTGLSKSYIYALVHNGQFPQSIRLVKGGTAVGWLESDVEQWIDDCINATKELAC